MSKKFSNLELGWLIGISFFILCLILFLLITLFVKRPKTEIIYVPENPNYKSPETIGVYETWRPR